MGDGGKVIKNINERSLILCRKNDENFFEKISKKVLTNEKIGRIMFNNKFAKENRHVCKQVLLLLLL